MLKKIKQHSVELKGAIDSSKYRLTEEEELQNEEQQKVEGQKKEIKENPLKLDELKSEKVDVLENFENEIHQKSEDFIRAPKEYDSKTLQQSIEQLETDLSKKISELNRYKEEMIHERDTIKEITSDDSVIMAPLQNIFEEAATDIDTLNKKLNLEFEQLTIELNGVRVKFNLLTNNSTS